jgi:aldehyde:ferredoxin oxidoreductase
MTYGYWGKILRINLSTGDISVDELYELGLDWLVEDLEKQGIFKE